MPQGGRCLSPSPATPRRRPCCRSFCPRSLLTRRLANRSSWVARARVRAAGGMTGGGGVLCLCHAAESLMNKGVLVPSSFVLRDSGLIRELWGRLVFNDRKSQSISFSSLFSRFISHAFRLQAVFFFKAQVLSEALLKVSPFVSDTTIQRWFQSKPLPV